MPVKNVMKFLAKGVAADQRLPPGEGGEETADHFRRRRRELIEFLKRAIGLQESIWCDL